MEIEKFKKRVLELVNDPVFAKPIQNTDYTKRIGTFKIITK